MGTLDLTIKNNEKAIHTDTEESLFYEVEKSSVFRTVGKIWDYYEYLFVLKTGGILEHS